MIPTFLGRWHTRILLFLFIGLPVSILYGLYLGEFEGSRRAIRVLGLALDPLPLQIVCVMTLIGLVLDPVYILIQQGRWDRDWPFAFQFIAMILEFAIVLALIRAELLPFVARGRIAEQDAFHIALHFSIVLILSFVAILGIVQVFLVRWRFKGGEIGRL